MKLYCNDAFFVEFVNISSVMSEVLFVTIYFINCSITYSTPINHCLTLLSLKISRGYFII